MAFPTTSTLDDFNRGSIGSNWTADPEGDGRSILVIASNALDGGAGAVHTAAWWNVAQYGPDCEAGAFASTWDSGGNFHGIRMYARLSSPGVNGSVDGYYCLFINDTGDVTNDIVEWYRINNGTDTQLTSGSVTNYANGDSLGIELIGADLKAYRKRGGTWSLIDSVTDGSPLNQSGYLGLHLTDGWTNGVLDDFFGGTIGSAAIEKVGAGVVGP